MTSQAKEHDMIRKRLIVCLIAAVMSCTCLFAFTACGSSDANDLVGEWKIKDRAGRIYTDRIKEKEGRNVSTGESICGKIPYVTGE